MNAGSRPGQRGRDRVARLQPVLDALEMVATTLPSSALPGVLRSARRGRSSAHRAWRFALLRASAKSCGVLVDIREDVYLFGIDRLALGSRISVHPLCYFDATGGITIGNDVSIAHSVTIMSTEHYVDRADVPIRDQGVTEAAVCIGDDVWVGAGARILAGVQIGSGSVVGAGSVVTRDVPDGVVVAGVPARVIRSRA